MYPYIIVISFLWESKFGKSLSHGLIMTLRPHIELGWTSTHPAKTMLTLFAMPQGGAREIQEKSPKNSSILLRNISEIKTHRMWWSNTNKVGELCSVCVWHFMKQPSKYCEAQNCSNVILWGLKMGFLDAIAYPSTYPCQWVSEWVGHW